MKRRNFIIAAGATSIAPVATFAAQSPLDVLYERWQEANASYEAEYCEESYSRIIQLEGQIANCPCETARDFAIKIVMSILFFEPPETTLDESLIADAQRVLGIST